MNLHSFQKHYSKNLRNFINLEKTFPTLKALGINVIRIPIPLDAILPPNNDFMVKCYKDALPFLTTVYEAAAKYRIGVYVTVVGARRQEVN